MNLLGADTSMVGIVMIFGNSELHAEVFWIQ